MGDLERVLTERLELRRPTDEDLGEVHALHADPGVEEHLPSGRRVLGQQTRVMVARWQQGWDDCGLGSWVGRGRGRGRDGEEAGRLLGVGGCDVRHGVVWNLGYCFHRRARGRGLAQGLISAARTAAAAVRPDLPVVAQVRERDEDSRRAARRAGLDLVRRGPDPGTPDAGGVRMVWADRPVPQDALALLVRS